MQFTYEGGRPLKGTVLREKRSLFSNVIFYRVTYRISYRIHTIAGLSEYFGGLSYSGVARIIERLKRDIEDDRGLKKRVEEIEKGMW